MRFFTKIERQAAIDNLERQAFEQIQSQETMLFNDWIESNVLLHSFFVLNSYHDYTDRGMLLQNALLPKFREYTANFFPDFLPNQDTFWSDFKGYLSYLPLTSNQKSKEIQPKIASKLRIRNEIENPGLMEESNSFEQAVYAFLNDEKILCYGSFPAEWGTIKLEFIEQSLNLLSHLHCTRNIAGFILKKLRLLNPHKEAAEVIENTWKVYQSGSANKQQNSFLQRAKLRKGILFVALLSFVALFIWLGNKLFSDDEISLSPKRYSSLVYFTVQQRKSIASILSRDKDTNINSSVYTNNGGQAFTIRETFENLAAEALYASLTSSLSQQYFNPNFNQDSTTQNKKVNNTKDITSNTIGELVKVKNSSDYCVLMIAFIESPQAPVWTGTFEPKEKKSIRLAQGMKLLFLPGKGFNGKPSLPFNEWDFNYDQGLENIYEYSGTKSSALVFHGKWGEGFNFADPYQYFVKK